jgi:hypothetical protein
VPPAGFDLNFPPEPAGGEQPAQQDDFGQGDWDQWIVNDQPIQQAPLPILPEEQLIQQDEIQLSNQHSGLSSDSSIGAGQLAPLPNGHFVENGHLLLGDAPLFGPQEVDGPVHQVDHVHDLEDLPHQAHVGEPNNNHPQNLEMNFMFSQEWLPDPVFQMFEERKRVAQFSRLWAKYFDPAGSADHSVDIPKKWAPLFLSNLLQPDTFNWSKTFLLSDIPSTLQEQGMKSIPFVVPKECPNDSSLEDVISGISKDSGGCGGPSPIIVESELRRSKRLKESRVGFRQGACPKRNCLMCQHNFDAPPPLSSKVLRNLGSRFCNLSEDDLSEQRLKQKKSAVGPVGQRRVGRKDLKDDKTDDSSDEDKQDKQ